MEMRCDRYSLRAWTGTAALCSSERDQAVGAGDCCDLLELTCRASGDHALQDLADCSVTGDNVAGRHNEHSVRLVQAQCCVEVSGVNDLEQKVITFFRCVRRYICSILLMRPTDWCSTAGGEADQQLERLVGRL